MVKPETEEKILAEINRLGMCDTAYIKKKFGLTWGEAKYSLSQLEKYGKVRFVPCGKWFKI